MSRQICATLKPLAGAAAIGLLASVALATAGRADPAGMRAAANSLRVHDVSPTFL
jgi:hypothetical protein